MADSYIRVRNWERFQQYKDRRPTWIKSYVELLDNYEYGQLSDVAKAHLHGIWLLAAATKNRLPADPGWIGKRIGASDRVRLDELISHGFIEYEPGSLPVRTDETVRVLEKRRDREEKETERTTEGAFAPPAAGLRPVPKVVTAEQWNSEAAEDFVAVYAGPPPAQFFAQVKPIAKRYGWGAVRPVLREYMAETDLDHLAIPKVLEVRVVRAAKGLASVRAGPSKASVGDRTMAALKRAEERRRGPERPGPGGDVSEGAQPDSRKLPAGA